MQKVNQQNFLKGVLHLLYPPRCPVCGQLVGTEASIHPECEKKLLYVQEPVCLKCGKPIQNAAQEYCFDCARGSSLIDGGISIWVYTKEMSHSIALYKYHGRREYAAFYVKKAVELCGDWILGHAPDCITAVPLNPRKERVRGFNQAMLLAEGIGEALEIPVDGKLLVRSRYTEPQKELDAASRMKNLRKAFGPGERAGTYRSVLLVDDIYTTGSTMKACTAILKENGVQKVWILSLCIGSEQERYSSRV